MPSDVKKRRGAPLGNINNFKHGFYSRRLKKRDLTGIESTDTAGLAEEIALIRVYTRRLVESFDPQGDFYDHADLLRILCLASTAITRVIRAQYLISSTGGEDEIGEAIKQVYAEIVAKRSQTLEASQLVDDLPLPVHNAPHGTCPSDA